MHHTYKKFLKLTYLFLTIAGIVIVMQVVLFYIQMQRLNCNTKIEGKDKRTVEDQIRKVDKSKQNRKLFPRFSLEDIEPHWYKQALVLQRPTQIRKSYMTIGIATSKRPGSTVYLYETLNSLLNNLSDRDKEEVCIIILLADLDKAWRGNVIKTMQNKYPTEIRNGNILLLQSFEWMYPKLDKLTHSYLGHSESRVRWKAKQNIDFAFLWIYVYARNISKYYLHLEDDVLTIPDYFKYMKDYINDTGQRWTCLEFSELGMIAKLYHTYDLKSLALMVTLFYEEQPADFTYLNFNPQMLQFRRLIRKPTLFQHIGRNSSLTGKIMLIQDRFFMNDRYRKILKGDNPPAEFETNLKIQPWLLPQKAYTDKVGYFWSESGPKEGDYFRIKFKSPQDICRIVVLSGMEPYLNDFFHKAVVETSSTINKTKTCIDYQWDGVFVNGTADIRLAQGTAIHCVQIRVLQSQSYWVIIKEIAIFLEKKKATKP